MLALDAGCSSASHAGAPDAGAAVASDAGGQSLRDAAPSLADAFTDDGTDDAAAALAPQASFRIADLSPDAPPIDVCVAPHGTAAFQGPFVQALVGVADASEGGAAPGLTYPQVSAYFSVPAGHYDVRIVAAGTPSCDVPLALDGGAAVDATNIPALAANSFTTLLAVGEVSPSGGDQTFGVTAIVDDAVLVSGAASLRAVNALPDALAQDFGLGSFTGGWLPLLTHVKYGEAGAQAAPDQAAVDSNGYLPIAPLAEATVSVRPSIAASSDTALSHSVSVDDGSVATLIAIGGDAAGARRFQLLLCIDNEPSGGVLSDCRITQ